jgi:hypothetical protein
LPPQAKIVIEGDSKGLKTFKNILTGLSGRAVIFLIFMSIFAIEIAKIDIKK